MKHAGKNMVKVLGLLVINAVFEKHLQNVWIIPVTHSVKELLHGKCTFTGMIHRPVVTLIFPSSASP
jgi:hypothetical protein